MDEPSPDTTNFFLNAAQQLRPRKEALDMSRELLDRAGVLMAEETHPLTPAKTHYHWLAADAYSKAQELYYCPRIVEPQEFGKWFEAYAEAQAAVEAVRP